MIRLPVGLALVVLVTVVAGSTGGWAFGIVAGAFAGAAVAWWVRSLLAAETADVKRQVRGWTDGTRPRTVSSRGLVELREIAELLDETGRGIDEWMAAMQADLPWRRELVEALPSATVLFDGNGYMVAANDAARELLRVPTDGERTTMLAALGNSQLADAVRRTSPGGGVITVDADVAGRQVRANIVAVGDQRLVLVVDRTRERRIEDIRRNFVVNASHELKTPATAIQALAEALVVTVNTSPERMPGLVERLDHESQRLVRLVHDLLDLRRLEDDSEVAREVVDVVDVLRHEAADMESLAAESDVSITLDVPQRVWVMMEEEDLRLTVRNLVSNAIQYNRPGGTVTVTVTPGWPVVLEVADTGIGIPRADMERVFERFYRVDVARSRATGGTGLGLSMVRHAVVRNGGSLEVESLLGTGSVFRAHLPAAQEERPGALSSTA
ncbi:MAG TPA: ATP-binding protein [Nitriliruptoraceae bacterium]|nr:ATP-binding protein [Nitriliruptoraceae bacterium]